MKHNLLLLRVVTAVVILLAYFYYEPGTPDYYTCMNMWATFFVGSILLDEIGSKK